jgi:type I restriction enzyme S subunit
MAGERWLGYRRTPTELMPEGWQLKRLREIASFAPGGSLGLTMSDYRAKGFDAYSAEGRSGKVAVAEFDGPAVVVSSIGSLCGKSFLAEGKFTTLANVQVVFPKPGEVEPYFLWNLLNAEAFWPRAQTGQPFIRPSDIKKAWIPLPPPAEQSHMAAILRSVDSRVAKAEAELAAAQRLKTALMQQLFTRGIPGRHKPYTRTKWLHAPAKWDVLPLREMAEIVSGFTMGRDLSGNELVTLPYLTVINVQEGRLDLSCIEPVAVKASEVQNLLLRHGDVLMTEGGDRDKLGRGCIWRGELEKCVFQNHIFRIRFKPDTYLPELFHFLLQSWQAKNYFYAHAKQTSNLCTINKRELRRFPVPTPHPDEQNEMLALLKTAEVNIQAIGAELKSLQRLRTSLLQNLLTGRVRVRMED